MTNDTIALQGVSLAPWQTNAVDAWCKGDGRPYRGTLEIFTGGGKTLMALACMERAAAVCPDLHVAIVVPSEALARQWRQVLADKTNISPHEVGLMGGGGHDTFQLFGMGPRVLVAVLNSAAKLMPGSIYRPDDTMLIVDECHRAGATKFSMVLNTPARFRLGLSATPDREELDDNGEPLTYDEQLVGRKLGKVVYRWMLSDARRIGWLPDFEINHHGVALRPGERAEYDMLSRRVDEAADRLRELGFDSGRAQQLRSRGGDTGQVATAYVAATTARKHLLYRAADREVLAQHLVAKVQAERADARIILFHERIDEAMALFEMLNIEVGSAFGHGRVTIEHSRLPDRQRQAALDMFRTGEVDVLVSVKSLIEGIDVPAANVGISVASSSSVRQRIQSLGRVLRRRFDDPASKTAEMHVIYVRDTVDEVIYGKQDWSDITGDGTNFFWKWTFDEGPSAEALPGPPRSPRPTEPMEWERLGCAAPTQAVPWLGEFVGQEYSVDTMGTVSNAWRAIIANSQGVGAMLQALRGRPGGRFRVTPTHRLVLARRDDGEAGSTFCLGRLDEPFEVLAEGDAGRPEPTRRLEPGEPMGGLPDKEGGSFKVAKKRGGVIERKVANGMEFALTSCSQRPELATNAVALLDAWRSLFDRGIDFHVSSRDDAWYIQEGVPRFLVYVPGGFSWPSDSEATS